MHLRFARTLSRLRHEKGVSQRQAAQELGVSQALLSHYENGIREPGLAFVVKACDYYRVSADYLLGRSTRQTEDGGEAPWPKRDSGTLLQTADALSQVCVDLCRREPELSLLFRRLAGQMSKQLGKDEEETGD